MDNLRFFDFLVVRRHVICVALCLLATTAGALRAEERAESEAPLTLAQQAGESEPAATAGVQKIQRLLKLLASRYPDRYGSVDPGRLDGVFGEETKLALRNFRTIAGLTRDPKPDAQLTADILSELALMSANESTDAPAIGGLDCARTPDVAACSNATPARPIAAAQAPKAAPPNPAKEEATPPEQLASVTPEAAKPADGKLYFVQAASLRSLESARQEWGRIKEANRVALNDEKVYFERADVKDRGIYYRILIGPQPDRDAANALCSVLKQNDRSCVVTSRSAADIRGVAEDKKDAVRPGSAGDVGKQQAAAPTLSVSRGAAPASPAPPAVAAPTPASPPEGSVPAPANPVPAAPATESGRLPAVESAPLAVPAPAFSTPVIPAPQPAPAPPIEQQHAALPAPVPLPSTEQRDQAAAKPDARPANTASGAQQPAERGIAARAAAIGEDILAELQDIRVLAALAALLIIGAVLFHKYRRIRRRAFSNALKATGLPIPGISEGEPEAGQTIATLEEDFESQQLRDSRLVRDEFLRSVLDETAESQQGIENGDSAIRINGSLKGLLATDPARYKSIFLNLIFLSKLGAALNRKEITLDQLNERIGHELDLLQSYFKIHLLELDDRHRIRRELPGLFYCLQLSQRQMKPQSVHFSAA